MAIRVPAGLEGRHFTRVAEWTPDELRLAIDLAGQLKVAERFGSVEGRRVAYLGDGNNVCSSLMIASAMLGASVVVATPAGYEPDGRAVETARGYGTVELTTDPHAAAEGADVLYTDVWTSMGHEAERERRLRDFEGYGIRADIVARAGTDAIVMHDLPAHSGEEITEDIL